MTYYEIVPARGTIFFTRIVWYITSRQYLPHYITYKMQLDGKTIQASIMQLIEDYKFDPYQVMEIVKLGLKSAFKKDYLPNDKKSQVQVTIDKGGNIRVFREYEVVPEVEDDSYQISLDDAKKHRKDIKEGELVLMDITPEKLEFSRIAVQAAAQTIKQSLK